MRQRRWIVSNPSTRTSRGACEVVQAQQDVVAANENYIASLFAHNLAKLTLLRAMGSAQKDVNLHLGSK